MGSRAQRREGEQYRVGKSAGFTWLLGRRNPKDSSKKLAARAFGAQDPAHEDDGDKGWSGPSAAATSWVGAAVNRDSAGNVVVLTPLGMEAEEEEDPSEQLVKEDGFVIRQFKNGWYKGDMRRGCLEGHGHFAFANGEGYEGEWVNNRMSGRGQYTYNDGSRYEGEYLAGKKNGIGRYTPALGESYMTRYEHGTLVESGEASVFSGAKGKLPHFTTLTRDFDQEQEEDEGAEDRSEPVGVGIKFKAVPEGGLEVWEVLAGGPADRDGRIDVGDRLFAIDGRNVYRAHISDVLPLIRGSGGSSVRLDFDREEPKGSGFHVKSNVTLERHVTHATAPKSILSSMKPSKQLYNLPLEMKEDIDSDEEQDESDAVVETAPVEPPKSKAQVQTKKGMSMAEVCESVYKSRNPQGAGTQSGTLEINKTLGTDGKIFDDEEDEDEDTDLSDEDEDDGPRPDFDLEGPRAVNPEMVYIYMKSDEMNTMCRDPPLRILLEESIKKELVHVLNCSFKIIEIYEMSPSVVPKGSVSDTEILGQALQLPEHNLNWKPGEDYDKSAVCMAIRVEVLVSIRGTGDIIKKDKVKSWQREKAEWLVQSFDLHERFSSWNRYHYLQHTSKVVLIGAWDMTRDRPARTQDFSNLAQRQLKSMEETRAIWSQRFMARYGNPVYLVLPMKQRVSLMEGTDKPITQATVDQTFTFFVRKRLNVLADGPRVFHLDLVEHCLHNFLPDTDGKVGDGKEHRKSLPFSMFKSVIPSIAKDTHVTIEFKPDKLGFRQRDYDFDFPTARDRKIFLLRLHGILDRSCFGESQDEDLAKRNPNNFGNQTVMRRTIAAYTLYGKAPWECDGLGNPVSDLESVAGFKGRTPHPDAAVGEEGANASTHAVPPNAITPGLSNQQAAYVQTRPYVAESFYGHSVYRSAHRSSAVGGDSASVGRSDMSRSDLPRARSSRGRSSRSPSRYLGDRASSFRSGGARTARTGRSSERGSRTTGGEDMTLKTLSIAQGSVRGQRHGEIEGVNFTDSDHVIAYKLLKKVPEGKQLTPAQVHEAVLGQFAVLAVKNKVESLVDKQERQAKQRKGVFFRKIQRKGLHPSRELLNDVNREIRGLEECKNFRRMMDECRLATAREVLGFPVAYPIQLRRPEPSDGVDPQEDAAISAGTSRVSGSQKTSVTAGDELRHPVLGEMFLEARVPNGNLLHDSYLIQTRDTKQVLLNVQQTPQGVLFIDQDLGEIASFSVLQADVWRCIIFGESQDFVITTTKEATGHQIYQLSGQQARGDRDLLVSWFDGHIHFKTDRFSIGDLKRDVGQGRNYYTDDGGTYRVYTAGQMVNENRRPG